jgi:uncharacterized protein (TIGR00730 family)
VKRICVYCGSSGGRHSDYAAAATALGQLLAQNGIGLVYGGAAIGIMGVIADAVLAGGGSVSGVIPQALKDKEIAHEGLTELHVVESMHERKSLMAVLSDGFIAMPGGYGTLEEIVETLTWGQLQFHNKPCGLLNVNGYFDHLLAFLQHAEAQGFIKSGHREMLLVDDNPQVLLNSFERYAAPEIPKLSGDREQARAAD